MHFEPGFLDHLTQSLSLAASTMKIWRTLTTLASVAAAVTRERVTWDSSGTQIVGYHYAPVCAQDQSLPLFPPSLPAIVLAHGLGGIQAAKLQPIAEKFASEGYHAITVSFMEHVAAKQCVETDGSLRRVLLSSITATGATATESRATLQI